MSACCDHAGGRTTWMRRVRGIFAWGLPSLTLLFIPKCPACLVAGVMLWTGIGLSLTAAAWLRWMLLILCIGTLLTLILIRLNRFLFRYFHKETKP